MEQTDCGPFSNLKRSTVRTFLKALSIWLKENGREHKGSTCRGPQPDRRIDDFTDGVTQGVDVAAEELGQSELENCKHSN